MSNYLIQGKTLTGIAEAIRERGETVDTFKPAEMAEAILNLTTGADAELLDALSQLETACAEMVETVTEGGIEVPKPYLHAYGYLQCVAECTDDNTQPVELYEWIYQRLYLGDRVDSVEVNGTAYATTMTSDDVDYLVIPVTQFSGITIDNYYDKTLSGGDTLLHYYYRVVYDNPALLGLVSFSATYYPSTGQMVELRIPLCTHGEQEEMLAACQTSAEQIDTKIAELYGVKPGDPLTVAQKQKVSKVIHDWIVLHSQYDEVNNGKEALDQTMYPALSGGVNDPVCASYALAYQWMALRYGIESVAVTGFVHNGNYKVQNGALTFAGGYHMWNMVNFHNTPGTYLGGDTKWTCVDLTWDDPTGTDDPDYIRWKYFHFPWSSIPQTPGQNGYRALDHRAYTEYPTDTPQEDDRYTGTTAYTWEES